MSNVTTLSWVAANSDTIECQIVVPGDFDPGADQITFHLLVVQTGGTDTITVDIVARLIRAATDISGAGDLYAGAAQPVSKSGTADVPEELSFVLSGNSLLRHDIIEIEVTPSAHANDALWLFAAWIEYTGM